jgi:hypothetical protein
VIIDECHHLSAHSFEQVVRQAKARFVVALSATVARKDGHYPIIFMQCGPVRHQVNARASAASRPFRKGACDSRRSRRCLARRMGRKQRQAVYHRLEGIPSHEGRIILATGKYVGERFDDPRLDTLFLTLPVSWRGTIAQYAGRLHRLYNGKREARIYDYVDLNVPMLARMFDRRCRGYESIGYTILLPASAVPRWPADVVLPSDPVWKRDYSGSVRRLIRDGVDTPLASLFVHTSQAMPTDAEGAARARSATCCALTRV